VADRSEPRRLVHALAIAEQICGRPIAGSDLLTEPIDSFAEIILTDGFRRTANFLRRFAA
jgi:hypothetical protein